MASRGATAQGPAAGGTCSSQLAFDALRVQPRQTYRFVDVFDVFNAA